MSAGARNAWECCWEERLIGTESWGESSRGRLWWRKYSSSGGCQPARSLHVNSKSMIFHVKSVLYQRESWAVSLCCRCLCCIFWEHSERDYYKENNVHVFIINRTSHGHPTFVFHHTGLFVSWGLLVLKPLALSGIMQGYFILLLPGLEYQDIHVIDNNF